MPAYGRFQVPEHPSSLARLHVHDGTELLTVTHEPKLGVLDQEDLFAQGIYVSRLITGAKDVDALGSCTANATVAAMSNVLPEDEFMTFATCSAYDDVVNAEEGAILFYHHCTDQTGEPQTEWPPTDCGSSGPYIVRQLETLNLISGDRIAHGPTALVSLLQTDGVLQGSPWFNLWEHPDATGFVDRDGSVEALNLAVSSGVAGGHETYLFGVECISQRDDGSVTPKLTILKARNSWSASWGTRGNYRIHLSTLAALAGYCDWRQVSA